MTLGADVMFVSGLPFLVALSWEITFLTVQYVPRRTAPELVNTITQVIYIYKRADFNPRLALMDGEFEKLKKKPGGKIDGPSISCLKGKWVRKKPSCVNLDCVSIPVSLIERN